MKPIMHAILGGGMRLARELGGLARPMGFDCGDIRRLRSGLALSEVRQHRVETCAAGCVSAGGYRTGVSAREKSRLATAFCFRALFAVLALGFLIDHAPLCAAQTNLQVFGFESPVLPPGSDRGLSRYLDRGMLFYPLTLPDGRPSQFGQFSSTGDRYPNNGTQYIGLIAGDTLGFARTNGQSFGLVSVDLAEYSTFFQTPKTIPFLGYSLDGSTVTQSFTTDGIMDGTGPQIDFETFYFDTSFGNVTRVELMTDGFMLDNLVVKPAVPEPATWMLLILGGAFVMVNLKRTG